MLAFLKSVSSLESSLRAWALDDTMRLMDASERAEWTSYFAEKDIKELAASVASTCKSQLEGDKMRMRLIGESATLKETWRHAHGLELVKDLV